ncbi:RING-like domain-containing protein [Paramyrothecium foliicola]|nr:RING-like domain-containing protein [Paramyrothecium foliicola]
MLDFLTKRTKKAKAEKDEHEPAGSKPDVPKISTDGNGSQGEAPPAAQDSLQTPAVASPGAGHSPLSPNSLHSPADPVLNSEDEAFIQSLLASEDGPPPPLPPRVSHDRDWPSDNEAASIDKALTTTNKETSPRGTKPEDKPEEGGKQKEKKKQNRLSLLFTRNKKNEDGLKPEGVSPAEGEKEKKDLSRVLDRLNLSAKNNKVVSMSNETSEALGKFTQVFKDLVNGVPTAYDDLLGLFNDNDGALSKGFEKLPDSLKKLVTQLPEKLTSSIAPELLAAAAESQGMKESSFDPKNTAEKLLLTKKIMELVTKPGAIVSMLRAIVEALKARWPAFIGMNVIWSVALTLLMLMLWYCHKRGREARLEREQSENVVDGSDRIEELPDDPALPAPKPATNASPVDAESSTASRQGGPDVALPHPPIGADAPSETGRS